MATPAWLDNAFSILRDIAARVWSFVKKRPGHILTAVVVVVVINQLLHYVSASAEQQITVYVGAPGSSSYRMSGRIADAIREISPTPGFHFGAAVVSTPGTIEIEQILSDDRAGRSIGLVADKIHHDRELQTLLPLDWDYLHVLARVGFLEDIVTANGGDWPTEFSQVVGDLKYARVFAGAQDSGTLKMASILFERHKSANNENIHDFIAPSLSNWDQALAALKAKQIDLAFYCGPLGATTVENVANDGSAVLLGLGELQSTLSQEQDFKLITVSIPRNSYRASPLMPAAGVGRPPLYFCDREIPTLAARRLVITSSRMSERDAYLISEALTSALTANQDIPPNTWQRDSPASPAGNVDSELGILPHPGAVLLRDKLGLWSWWKPWTWSATWRSIALGLASLLATSSLQLVHQRLQGKTDRSGALDISPAEPAPDYDRLFAEIESDLNALEHVPEPLQPEEHQRWVDRVIQWRASIRAQRKEGKITKKQSDVLLAAIRNLEDELSSIKVALPAGPSKKKATSGKP